MFVLHVDLSIKPGMTKALESTYRDVFVPAISKQAGFSEVKLLRAIDSETQSPRLVIAFEREELQKKWVATDLHQEVWPKMNANMAHFTIKKYETV
jgi:heme-degrading monooxygenase HmoA